MNNVVTMTGFQFLKDHIYPREVTEPRVTKLYYYGS